ncbi:MAG: hypothetical protein WDZ40_01360 [Candidatus Spechtbacterales bacterium]
MFAVTEVIFYTELWIGQIEYDKYTYSRGKTKQSEKYGPFNTEEEAEEKKGELQKLYKNKTNIGGEVEIHVYEKEVTFFEADNLRSLYGKVENLWRRGRTWGDELRHDIKKLEAELERKRQELNRTDKGGR